jgi:hypothetical protein
MRYGWVHAGTVSSRDWKVPLNIEEGTDGEREPGIVVR